VWRRIRKREAVIGPLQQFHPGLGVADQDQGAGQEVESDQEVARVALEGREAREDQEAEERGRRASIVLHQLSHPGVPLAMMIERRARIVLRQLSHPGVPLPLAMMTGTGETTEAWDGKWKMGFRDLGKSYFADSVKLR